MVEDDWDGEKYCGITLDWDYVRHQVHLSMPGYVDNALIQFRHELRKITNQPHKHALPVYGATVQYAKDQNTSTKLGKTETLFI